jgi:S-adenosylmethionine decarboxylase
MNHPVPNITVGTEWVIDAIGCAPETLRSEEVLRRLFDDVVRELDLHPAAPALWKVFPGEAGITGLWMLQESHLTVHTFPEHAAASLNLYCCSERREWEWETELVRRLRATMVSVRVLARGRAALADKAHPRTAEAPRAAEPPRTKSSSVPDSEVG